MVAVLLDPNIAFVLLVLGALGVYWEMHAPGMVAPGALGVILACAGMYGLLHGSGDVSPPVAISATAAFAVIAVFLGYLGMRERKRKHATGIQTLVGATGISRTAIDPEGTVFVNGEYWKALSEQPIPAGQRVRIDAIDNLVLHVKKAS